MSRKSLNKDLKTGHILRAHVCVCMCVCFRVYVRLHLAVYRKYNVYLDTMDLCRLSCSTGMNYT